MLELWYEIFLIYGSLVFILDCLLLIIFLSFILWIWRNNND